MNFHRPQLTPITNNVKILTTMPKPTALTNDEKITILGQHVAVLHNLIKAQNLSQYKQANAAATGPPTALGLGIHHAAAAATPGSFPPPRPSVVQVVIATLRDAQIMNNAQEGTPLTARFNEVQTEDAHMGHAGFRINAFLNLLHQRLTWWWGIAPSELLNGDLPTAGDIADRCLASA